MLAEVVGGAFVVLGVLLVVLTLAEVVGGAVVAMLMLAEVVGGAVVDGADAWERLETPTPLKVAAYTVDPIAYTPNTLLFPNPSEVV